MRPALLMAAALIALWAGARATAVDLSMPVRIAASRDGSLFLWNYSRLQACPASGSPCAPVVLPRPQVRVVLPRPVSHAYVLAEQTNYTEHEGTSFDQGINLVDARGQIVESWDMPEGVLDIIAPGRRAYVLTGDRQVVRLDPKGQRTVILAAGSRDESLFMDAERQLVLCRPSDIAESITRADDTGRRAGCTSQAGWSFEGHWYSVAPIVCGEWLVEPVMKGAGAARTADLQVRTLADGAVVGAAPLAVGELRCLEGPALYDLATQRRISLPALVVEKGGSCGQRRARDVANGTRDVCMDDRGAVATLK